MITIAPSILSADFSDLTSEITRVEQAGANYIHLDVMDGAFVPNISFGAPVIASLRKVTKLFFDVHLMIRDPGRYIEDFARAGADGITIHAESTKDPLEVLRKIQEYDIRPGIAISPKTPYETILPLLSEVGMVLVMTVEPGFGGQSLIVDTLTKVHGLRKFIEERDLPILVEVDGGITPETVGLTTAAGANVIVAGSSIFKTRATKRAITALRDGADANPYIG